MSASIHNLEKAFVYILSSNSSYMATFINAVKREVEKATKGGVLDEADIVRLLMGMSQDKQLEVQDAAKSVAKINNRLLVDMGFKKFVEKDNYFSDIETWFLPVLKMACEKSSMLSAYPHELLQVYLQMGEMSKDFKSDMRKLLPIDEKIYAKLLDKDSGLTEHDRDVATQTYRFNKYFGEGKLRVIIESLKERLEEEYRNRLKKSRKYASSTKGSMDDSVIDLRHQKKMHKDFLEEIEGKVTDAVIKAKDFDEIERLYLAYTTSRGGDLINAFLRGDLSLVELKKDLKREKQDASWGTDLTLDPATFVEIMDKALKLKKNLMTSKIEDEMTVYRGVSFAKVLASVKNNNPKNVDIVKSRIEDMSKENFEMVDKSFSNERIIYQSKDITSTTTDRNNALGHAQRTRKSDDILRIVMVIKLKKGTAFGKDFKNTTFGEDDYNSEVVLAPEQKIRINDVEREGETIFLNCETTQSNADFH